jgi:DNA-binding response OmpR family regulator
MTLVGKHIVAIDDTQSIRTFLRVSLEDEGAHFHEAATAMEGFELCKKIKPHLIVLDLGLPDMDGLDLLPMLKAQFSSDEKYTPRVIVLTVRKGRKTIEDACQKGADSYLTKPFMVDDLLDVIDEELDGLE